ncbi:hypothetical protein [Kitasatospora sp. NPDC054795]
MTALPADMLQAAARHGIALDTFDWFADLPGSRYAAVVSPLRAQARQWATAG